MPVSGGPSPTSPVSPAAAFAAGGAPVAAPVRPGSEARAAEEPPARRARSRTAIIAGAAALVLLVIGGAFALKVFNDKDDTGGPGATGPSAIGQWAKLPDLPGVALEGAGAAIADGKLYVVGGLSAEDPRPLLGAVHVYDIAAGSWSAGPALPEPMSHMVVLRDPNDAIWVLGGLTKSGATAKVWILRPGSPRWEEGPALPEPRNSGAGLYDGEGIVFAGGTKPGGLATDTVWVLRNERWDVVGALTEPREKLAATTDNAGTVWFVGGVKQSAGNLQKDTIDVMVHQKMVLAPNLKLDHAREGASAVRITGIGLCAFGGNDREKVYDWWCEDSSKTPLLPKQAMPRAGMAVAVSNGVIYTVGGYNGTQQVNGTKTVEAFKYNG
jgi:hypothetical protein